MTEATRGHIVAATIGDCVHVAGVLKFLQLARALGFSATFLGTRVPIPTLISCISEQQPDIVGISYRLSADSFRRLATDLKDAVDRAGLHRTRFAFGGTDPVCEAARSAGLFEKVFGSGDSDSDVVTYLTGERSEGEATAPPSELIDRISWKAPRPLLRHHFGQPRLDETISGVGEISRAGVLDVLSLGPDQNAQVAFFRPEEQDPRQAGAGGVPVRSPDDLRRIYEATRTGNFPLMRCYSGTRDVLRFAQTLRDTIRNAWCAVPLFWYNTLDGRGPRDLRTSIREGQQLMRWHARRGIPVEVNESHHWSLRRAHDSVAVAAAYLAAYNARHMGVQDYVAQYMFNTPPETSFRMDLAKMMAKQDLIESLSSPTFRVWRQTRAGLASFPADPEEARGRLAASTVLQMALDPHIVHVVGYCEADHAATAQEVIASCRIIEGVISSCWDGLPDLTLDPGVQDRRRLLVAEARVLLGALAELGDGGSDPFVDPEILAQAVELGYLDAPHLAGNPHARGQLVTSMIDGACLAVDPASGRPMSEEERVHALRAGS